MECFHCLQPVPRGVNLSVEYKGSEKPVCCAGCQAVAETIIEHRLHAYYEHRDISQLQETPVLPDELNDLNLVAARTTSDILYCQSGNLSAITFVSYKLFL